MASRPSDEVSVPVGSSRRMPHIGPWRLLELRSGGAYGQVYRAEPLHSPGAPPVALKLAVHPMDPRFLREAGLLRRVPHSHIPRLYELGLWDHPAGPFPYLVMEWIEGQSLYAWAHRRVLSSRQMMRMLAPMAETLAALHAADAAFASKTARKMPVSTALAPGTYPAVFSVVWYARRSFWSFAHCSGRA